MEAVERFRIKAWNDALKEQHAKVLAWSFRPVQNNELPLHHKFKEFELCALQVKFEEEDAKEEEEEEREEEEDDECWTTYYIVPWFQAPWSQAQNAVTPPIYPQLHETLHVYAVHKLYPQIGELELTRLELPKSAMLPKDIEKAATTCVANYLRRITHINNLDEKGKLSCGLIGVCMTMVAMCGTVTPKRKKTLAIKMDIWPDCMLANPL